MSDEKAPDQTSQSGGVTANVGGDLSAGQDIVGRDSIVSTTTETTNVFNSDRLATRGLVVLLGVAILGLLGLVVIVLSQSASASSVATLQPSALSATLGSPVQTAVPTNTQSLASVSTVLPPSATVLSLPVELPDDHMVMMIDPSGDKFQYTILSAQREPLSPDRYLLHLRIRAWTDSVGGMDFWSDSFRLVAGDLRLVPVNDMDELVNPDETVDGDVEFEIDGSLKDAVLAITVGGVNFSENTKQVHLIFP